MAHTSFSWMADSEVINVVSNIESATELETELARRLRESNEQAHRLREALDHLQEEVDQINSREEGCE